MKDRLSLLSLFLLMAAFAMAGTKPVNVVFILTSPNLSSDSAVYITGSLPELGNWNASRVKMEPTGNHTWRKEITVESLTPIEFKFTLGNWGTEGVDDKGDALPNFTATVVSDTVINSTVQHWMKGRTKKVSGQVTGMLKYHNAMSYPGLLDRDVVVWLPPGYDTDKATHYPVLYMHDGQNIFDPATSSFGTDWQVDETCDSLIRNHRIPALIVVGIYSTADRSLDYAPGEKGEAYMNFIVQKLKPLIDSTYRTLPGRENTLVGGSSRGGIISMMLLWQHPTVFSKAICMSPAFKYDNVNYSKDLQKYGVPKNVYVYMDNGGVGLEEVLQPGIDDMMRELNRLGFKKEHDYIFVKDPTAQHFEGAWAKRMPAALVWCFLRPGK